MCSNQPALYRDMLDVAITELSGIDGAEAIARRIASSFCDRHSEKVYRVPVLQGIKKAERDARIREQSHTMSVAQIAKAHGLSEGHVREILSGVF